MQIEVKQHLPEPSVYPETSCALAPSLFSEEAHGVRCLACARRCLLKENQVGFCTAIVNWGNVLHSTAYGVIGEASVAPIENKPVYHYRPGSRVLNLGGIGCNLRCAFCQNWTLAFRDARSAGNLATPNFTPEQAITTAIEQKCQGIAWTFNEPSISPMYVLDCAQLAYSAGLYTVFVTNGMLTAEALDLLGPWITVYRVDVKSIHTDFYRQVAGTTHIHDILPIARRAQQEFGIHVETVTNVMPTLNDSDEHLQKLTERIVTSLGERTPWHVTTYVPYAHMTHIPSTPNETILRARDTGIRSGLRFIYTDVISVPETRHTYCPTCQALLIERYVDRTFIHMLDKQGRCTLCGTASGIVVEL